MKTTHRTRFHSTQVRSALWGISLFGLAMTGCGEKNVWFEENSTTLTQVRLIPDVLGALQLQDCLDTHGEGFCARYPNPLECSELRVKVLKTGGTTAECFSPEGLIEINRGSISNGIPFTCQASEEAGCGFCADIFGSTVINTCSVNLELYKSDGWTQEDLLKLIEKRKKEANSILDGGTSSHDAGHTTPSETEEEIDENLQTISGNETSPTTIDTLDPCDAINARKLYAQELNKILAAEGLAFSYAPNFANAHTAKVKSDFFKYSENKNDDICAYWDQEASQGSKYTKCDNGSKYTQLDDAIAQLNGQKLTSPSTGADRCFCSGSPDHPSCRCGRINVAAVRAACKQLPTQCDRATWVAELTIEYGIATHWLTSGSYKNGMQPYSADWMNQGGATGIPNQEAPKTLDGTPTATGADEIQCLGSPLVLDLGGNGLDLTSLDHGVDFSLLATGRKHKTAWISGDDALLVMDRNGNGRIDDGSELFGEATMLNGRQAENGFEALAQFDTKARGGNENGTFDRGDAMFAEVRLWNDFNRDGISQAHELSTLEEQHIHSLDLNFTKGFGELDRHGNDLAMQSTFKRLDGRTGSLIDVLFLMK